MPGFYNYIFYLNNLKLIINPPKKQNHRCWYVGTKTMEKEQMPRITLNER